MDVTPYVNKPSAMVRAESAIFTGENLVDGWSQYISESQMKRALEILGLFGLDKIYGEDARPIKENLGEIWKVAV